MDDKTNEIVANDYGKDSDVVLTQIKNEFRQGYEAVSAKRKSREKDIREKYVPVSIGDKVNIHSIYTTIQTLMSVYYSDRMIVEFAPRKKTFIEKAAQVNRLAQFDYDEMGLDKIDYEWAFDTFMHGVGIKTIENWDDNREVPVARVVNPLCWIPDPRGGFDISTHRWAGFEMEMTKLEMKRLGMYNVDLVNSASEGVQNEIYQAYQTGRGILTDYVDSTENKKFPIYNHYTILDGEKYLVTTANHNTIIIRMIKLPAITKAEAKNNSLILFPIALKYYSPVKGDAFGISVPDLLRDKQSSESKLFNLTLIAATRNALGDDKIYNPKKIKNIKDLQKPSIEGRYIPANIREGEDLGSVIMTVPKDNPTSLPLDIQSTIRFQSSISTGLDSNALGIQGQGNQTATEAQITQKNANLRFILGTAVAKWGETTFWRLWYRSYIFNLKKGSVKNIRISKGFDEKYYEITKDDFITEENIDIKIISTSEKASLENKQKADFYAIAPQFLSDASLPQISKTYIKRKMYRLAGLEEEEILRLVPKSLDERLAELDVELINNKQAANKPKPGQDHLTFLNILEQADENKHKAEAIGERTQAYIDEGQQAIENMMKEQSGDNTAANIAQSNASSRMSSNMMKESQKNSTPSLGDVAGI